MKQVKCSVHCAVKQVKCTVHCTVRQVYSTLFKCNVSRCGKQEGEGQGRQDPGVPYYQLYRLDQVNTGMALGVDFI